MSQPRLKSVRGGKRDLGAALDASLSGKLEDRFSAAEKFLEDATDAPPIAPNAPKAEPKPPARAKKPQPRIGVVRDTFSFPEDDYALISALRDRLLGQGIALTKSELLRAGLLLLESLEDAPLKAAAGRVRKLKPGRPAG